MEILFYLAIIVGLYYVFFKKNNSKKPETINVNGTGDNKGHENDSKETTFEDEINSLRQSVRQAKDAEINPVREAVRKQKEAEKIAQDIVNKEADKLGLRKSLAYLVDDMQYWPSWKSNSKGYFSELSQIDGYEFIDAIEKEGGYPRYFFVEFKFNGERYVLEYDGSVKIYKGEEADAERIFEMVVDYQSDEYTSEFIPKDVKVLVKGEWIKVIILIEETMKAYSRKSMIEMGFTHYDN